MVKKIINISCEVLFAGLCLAIVLHSTLFFEKSTIRLLQIANIKELKTFFEIKSDNNFPVFFEEIYETFMKSIEFLFDNKLDISEKFLRIINQFLETVYEFILNFCNIGLNIILVLFLFLHETLSGKNSNIKYSKGAKIYFKFENLKDKFKCKIRYLFINLWNLIKNKKRFIIFHLFLLMLSYGYIYRLIIETLIFIIVYFIRVIEQETYLLIFKFVQYIFVMMYPILIKIPKFIFIPLTYILIFILSIQKANHRLIKNTEDLKKFVSNEITQTTFINGPPGAGKTLLNVSLTLASEENYLEELEKNMRVYETKFPKINFAIYRNNLKKEHLEYQKYYYYAAKRGALNISNYSIYSPYFSEFSKIFNFDYMRKNKKVSLYPLEEYINISLSEFDKEYNSHDNMKDVGEDGAAAFFSTVSHDLKRHVKIFVDYQLKDQVPLRIRGNAEYFFTIHKRAKKFPLFIYAYYLPFLSLDKFIQNLIKKYETERKAINHHTTRLGQFNYKRNDYTLIYALIRKAAFISNKICNFFEHYAFFKITGDLSYRDGEEGKKKILYLNLCDLDINNHKLYDSTFLSYAYQSKKNEDFKNLSRFSSLTPSIEELNQCHSRFYDKINNIQEPIQNKNNNDESIVDL